jgi:hypothetical protein
LAPHGRVDAPPFFSYFLFVLTWFFLFSFSFLITGGQRLGIYRHGAG